MLHNFIQDNKVTLTYLTHHDLADTQKHIQRPGATAALKKYGDEDLKIQARPTGLLNITTNQAYMPI